ncbi:MAG: histidinol-phosphatase [Spirochaetales bacterium]|nr:histidinol-phosphatase [Spirochaetales bacterium]
MILTNYHTHTIYCDGKGKPKAYAEAALEKGLTALGFSSHSPWPDSVCGIKEKQVPKYIKEIEGLRKTYEGRLEIYLGLEIEYFPGFSSAADEYYDTLPLDYRIGSLHSLYDESEKKWYAVDGPEEEYKHILNDMCGGIMENFVRQYYGHIRDMIKVGRFEILGHLDLIKKHNKGEVYFTEDASWYRDEIQKTLDCLEGTGIILEVNTGGLSRGYTETVYPSPWILAEACQRNIPTQLNGDAHAPENLDFAYAEAREIMAEAGYDQVRLLLGGEWVNRPLA